MADFIKNSVLMLISLFVCFIMINVFFVFVYNQDIFSRSLVSLSGTFQYTYYPKTFDWSSGDDYLAITGDSYSEGAGDSFLNNDRDYSIAHFLHQDSGQNFLIFGRSGYGSVSAATSVVENIRFSHFSPYFRDLGTPEEILFFFYEGNDLNNNLEFLNYHGIKPGENFDREIEQAIRAHQASGYTDWKIRLRAFVPTIDLLANLYRHMPILLGFKEPDPNGEEVWRDDRSTILSAPDGNLGLPPLQTAAVELTDDEIDRAIRVFDASINYLKTTFPETPIRVVYLPSIVGVYDWESDIRIQKYTSSSKNRTTAEENNRVSRKIRERFAELGAEQGWDLIDTTPMLRAEAKTAILHGPEDWYHFNQRGYEQVAKALLRQPMSDQASQ